MYAAKYWPGHAATIAPGFALGMPALVPLLLSGLTGALVFALARRLAGASVAAVTWVLWIGTFGNLRFRAAYFSELTTSLAWLAAWWALLEWRETKRPRWMVALAVVIGWGAITRPPTMFVFAIPVAVVVLRDAWRHRLWSQVAAGIAAGTAVLLILPLWNAEVTGSARTTPMALYTRQYLPFDIPGYTVDTTPPERALPPEMERVRGFLRDIKAEQATAPAWRTAFERGGLLLRDAFRSWRLPFAIAFAVGVVTAGAAGWFAIGTGALLIFAYLSQAHTADWVVYYLETMPAIAFVTALGLATIVRRATRVRPAPAMPPIAGPVVAAGVAGLLLLDVSRARDILGRVGAEPRAFRAAVGRLPKSPNIVFVRYAARRNMHISLVANDGLLDGARSWIVHDRGDDNARLRAMAPTRAAWLFDEAAGEFRELVP